MKNNIVDDIRQLAEKGVEYIYDYFIAHDLVPAELIEKIQ